MPYGIFARLIAGLIADGAMELVKYQENKERESDGFPPMYSDPRVDDMTERDLRMGSHYTALREVYEAKAESREQMLQEQRKSYVFSDKGGSIGMDEITPIGVMPPKRDEGDDENFL